MQRRIATWQFSVALETLMARSGKALSSTERSRRRREGKTEPTEAQLWHKKNSVSGLKFMASFCDHISERTFHRRRARALDLLDTIAGLEPGADLPRLAESFHKWYWFYLLPEEWRSLRRQVQKFAPKLAELMRPDHFEDPGWSRHPELADNVWRRAPED